MSNQSIPISSKLQIVFYLIKKKKTKTLIICYNITKRKKRVANKLSHGTHVVSVIIYRSGLLVSQKTSLFHSGNECHRAHRKQSSEAATLSAQTQSRSQLLVLYFPASWHFSGHI